MEINGEFTNSLKEKSTHILGYYKLHFLLKVGDILYSTLIEGLVSSLVIIQDYKAL